MSALVRRKDREPTITLINIVFLLLVFFMVAGTLAPPPDRALALVETSGLEGREPAGALVIHADGRMSVRGETVPSVAAYAATLSGDRAGRIIPDRALDADALLRASAALREAGAASVLIVTERAAR